MSRVWKYNNYLYIASRILIGMDIIRRFSSSTIELFLYLFLFLLVIVNDQLRSYHFYKDSNRYYKSILVSMILSGVLIYNIRGYSDILMYIIIYELVLFTEGKLSKLFIIIETIFILSITIFLNINMIDLLDIDFWKESIIDILMSSVGLLFFIFMLYAYRNLRIEKRKVDSLHKELELSYEKLKEQSKEIEELSIAKERNRLAGEIHDNLGHNLVALNMNLDVASKILNKDVNKAIALMDKAQLITKKSIDDLRKAVYALKEEEPFSLGDSINRLVDTFPKDDHLQFIIETDENLDSLPKKHGEILFISIKESITNSIKHGNPKLININIEFKDSRLVASIKDDGKGCMDLVKGTGFLGIEERLGRIGGTVTYNYGNNKGFEVILALKGSW